MRKKQGYNRIKALGLCQGCTRPSWPSGWVDLELCLRVWYNRAPNLGLYSMNNYYSFCFNHTGLISDGTKIEYPRLKTCYVSLSLSIIPLWPFMGPEIQGGLETTWCHFIMVWKGDHHSQCQGLVCLCYLQRSSHGAGSSLFHTLDRPFSLLHQCSKLRFLQRSFLPMGEHVRVEMRTEKMEQNCHSSLKVLAQ